MFNRKVLLISSIFIILVLCYTVLVIGNVLLQRIYNNNISAYNSEALAIEEKRIAYEDIFEIEIAKKEGYIPVIPPVHFDYPRRIKGLQDLAKEYKFIPLGAQPNESVYYCNEGYGLIKYKSDRYGFRNPDYLWDKADDTQILLIGDSFVHGACVDEDNTFRSHIAKVYPYTLNLGMSGSGPNNYIRTADYFIKKINPEKVIIFIFANDNEGRYPSIFNKNTFKNPYHLLENKNYLKLKDFYKQASLISTHKKTKPEKSNIFIRLNDDLKLEFIRRLIFNNSGVIHSLIDDVVDLCDQHLCEPYFVYLPTSQFWRPDSRQDEFRRSIKMFLTEKHDMGSNFIDATEVINNNELFFAPKGPHYSNEGYELISLRIIEMIK